MSDDNNKMQYEIVILVLNIVLVIYTFVNKIYKSCTTGKVEKTDTERIEKALKYLADHDIEAQIINKKIDIQ